MDTKNLFKTKTFWINGALVVVSAIASYLTSTIPPEVFWAQVASFVMAMVQRLQVTPETSVQSLSQRPEVAAQSTLAMGISGAAVLGVLPIEAIVTSIITAIINIFVARVTEKPAKVLPQK